MNNKLAAIIFIIAVAVVLGIGVWYNNSRPNIVINNQISQTQGAQSAATQQTQQQTQQPTQTMNELKITDIKVGTGAEVKTGDTVNVLYAGSLDDGTVFDASSRHGNQPFSFTVPGQVIQGWNLGIIGMKVGGTRELVIPSSLGYGPQGAGGVIPPTATLHFTIELLSIGK